MERTAPPQHEPIHIQSVELRRVRLRLQKPFKTSFGTQQNRDTILVFLHTKDGVMGMGETPSLMAPIFDHQYVWADFDVLKRFLIPALMENAGGVILRYEQLQEVFASIKAHHFAKCGIEAAYWHLISQQAQIPLAELWGASADHVPTGFSIGGSTIYDVLDRASEAVDAGFRRLKIKIWPGFDRMVVDAVRQRFPNIMLQVDANASYDPFDAGHIDALKSLDDFDLLLIEQPFAANRIFDHAQFQKQHDIQTPFCLDESLLTPDDARQALALWTSFEIGERLIFNIKPPRLGGFWPSRQIADFAQAHGVTCWVGGMLETGIGKWMNAIFAAHPVCTLPGDHLQPQPYYEQDIVTPLPEANKRGMIAVPKDLQVWQVDERALETLTVEKYLYP